MTPVGVRPLGGLARRNHLDPRTVYPPERRGLLQVDAPKKGQAGRGPFLGSQAWWGLQQRQSTRCWDSSAENGIARFIR
jgi:hypothetical protein